MSRESQQAREDRLSMEMEENDQIQQAIADEVKFRAALFEISQLQQVQEDVWLIVSNALGYAIDAKSVQLPKGET